MKASKNWLCEYVDLKDITDKITNPSMFSSISKYIKEYLELE